MLKYSMGDWVVVNHPHKDNIELGSLCTVLSEKDGMYLLRTLKGTSISFYSQPDFMRPFWVQAGDILWNPDGASVIEIAGVSWKSGIMIMHVLIQTRADMSWQNNTIFHDFIQRLYSFEPPENPPTFTLPNAP